jgi:hypothetical protein
VHPTVGHAEEAQFIDLIPIHTEFLFEKNKKDNKSFLLANFISCVLLYMSGVCFPTDLHKNLKIRDFLISSVNLCVVARTNMHVLSPHSLSKTQNLLHYQII